ncbi:nucleoside deaminase [Nocardiopsis potens]|uniref:nucleoside deaminase n=1 Tax=Nocardiopsis potens TaxID=1246458 RepID=UPI000345B075
MDGTGAGTGPLQDRALLDAALERALEEGELALRTGDVPVGAVVLDASGREVGAGRNEREAAGDPTAHAEVLALRAAARRLGGWRLAGCTLVVTLEPCTMCAGAAVLSRVDRIAYGARDAKAGAAGSLWDLVRDPRLNHRPEVVPPDLLSPRLGERCADLLTDFFSGRRFG